MFLGEYEHVIDDKGRLTIPSKYRRPLLDGLVITRGLDKNLVIFPLGEWNGIVERINKLSYGDSGARHFRRLMFSGACDAEPDRQGRVNIPPYLLEAAGISKEVVIVGVYSYIELWSPSRWNETRDALDNEDNADRWAGLGI